MSKKRSEHGNDIKVKKLFLSIILIWNILLCADTIHVPDDYLTIQSAIDAAVNGDIVLIATGLYYENLEINSKTITLASEYLDSNDEQDIFQTIIDGGGQTTLIITSSAKDTTVIGLTFRNAEDGISVLTKTYIFNNRFTGCSDGIDYEQGSGGVCGYNLFENNSDDGIDLDYDINIIILENIIRNNGDDGIEIRLHNYNGPILTYIIRNNVIYGNREDGIQLIDYPGFSDRVFYIENNIILKNSMAAIGCMSNGNTIENYEGASIPEPVHLINNTFAENNYGLTGGGNMVVKNNIFMDTNETALKNVDGQSVIVYNSFWNNGMNFDGSLPGTGNIYVNPLFVNIVIEDFHLQSEFGRWDNNQNKWIADSNTSPCIDTGAPNSNWIMEVWPHGKRINIGAYGGTNQASMSPSTIGNAADFNNDNVVDGKDLSALSNEWLKTNLPVVVDINRDGTVNFFDFVEFGRNWHWSE